MSLLDLAPPHSVEAEQGVIGGLMLDNSTWDLIADVLSADDFFRRDHRLIYQAIHKWNRLNVVVVFKYAPMPTDCSYMG